MSSTRTQAQHMTHMPPPFPFVCTACAESLRTVHHADQTVLSSTGWCAHCTSPSVQQLLCPYNPVVTCSSVMLSLLTNCACLTHTLGCRAHLLSPAACLVRRPFSHSQDIIQQQQQLSHLVSILARVCTWKLLPGMAHLCHQVLCGLCVHCQGLVDGNLQATSCECTVHLRDGPMPTVAQQ